MLMHVPLPCPAPGSKKLRSSGQSRSAGRQFQQASASEKFFSHVLTKLYYTRSQLM